jgi:uncharacterized protein (TIGR02145 family)
VKTRILLNLLMIGMSMGTYAQKPTITLTFTADSNGRHIPLNSILIRNLTQGSETTLYAPDTVLVLDYITGMNENIAFNDNSFSLSQNFPNPMEDQTQVRLYLHKKENILITISDVIGRELVKKEFHLEHGIHSFSFYPGNESLYVLTARADQQSRTIKMFNSQSAAAGEGVCTLVYNGTKNVSTGYKSEIMLNNFVFDLGDQLQYSASSALGNRTIIDTPSGNQTYTFQYGISVMPCPGMPTITDIDGNIYNTVLINEQCWMKENLKTTTYNNGTSIPNVTDDNAWSNLTFGAYAWFDNDISWKDSYGALYNWFTTVDPNGLCPTGWHVPTYNEWTALPDYIGGPNSPHGNELKSCRQVNSPPGGNCNTSEHPRWEEDTLYSNYGTDDYGFSGLPGGRRQRQGNFNGPGIGNISYWWSSVEFYPSISAFYCFLAYNEGGVILGGTYYQNGFSVRCLRD